MNAASDKRTYTRFQFHKGTIKTDVTTAEKIYAALFQFHKGTIKTFRKAEKW